jgi:hypothetical protein
VFPLNLYARVRFLCAIARETAGAARTRSSLRPLISEGANEIAKLGRTASRECGGACRRHSGMRLLAQASDVQLHIGESILIIVVMDSGLALRVPRNDEGKIAGCRSANSVFTIHASCHTGYPLLA